MTSRFRSAFGAVPAAVVLTLLLAACSDGGARSGGPSPTGSASPSASASGAPQQQVELVAAGAEPRVPLRFSARKGDKARLTMTMTMALEMSLNGRKAPQTEIPPIRLLLDTSITDVSPTGDLTYEFVASDVTLVGKAKQPALGEQLLTALRKLVGFSGEATVTARGVTLTSSVDLPDDVDPSLRSMIEQVSSQAARLATPFPEQPVGIGARWTSTATAEVGGIETRTTSTYTLRKRTADGYDLGVVLEQNAPPQRADFPGVPAGTVVDIESMSGDGTGTVSGTLRNPMVMRSTVTLDADTAMRIESASENGTLQQKLSMKMDLEGVAT